MSDAPESLPEGIHPEDFEWALAHLKKLDALYQHKVTAGEHTMIAAIMDPIEDRDLLIRDASEPCGYRLAGRAHVLFLLLQQSVDVTIDRMDVLAMTGLYAENSDALKMQFIGSEKKVSDHKGLRRLCPYRIVLIATW